MATGPSLAASQLAPVEAAHARGECRVITVNDAAAFAPWADAHYVGDYLWLKHRLHGYRPNARGTWWTGSDAGAVRWQLQYVRASGRPGLGSDRVHLNGNSGAQAINLAAIFGARRVLLLGFDMKPGADGRLHVFGSHPAPLVQECLFEEWLHKFAPIARDAEAMGLEIINCTPGSALTLFPASSIEREL
ncbi:MAG: hypothetical protein KF863_21520 [Rubrivivax sp.]|nr:hypothetical protein [Rubrivivax sp.]